MTNRTSHMRFPLTPRSMTLTCYNFEFCRNFSGFRKFALADLGADNG